MERDSLHHKPEGEHEDEERDIEGKADVAHLCASVHQGRHSQDDGTAERGERRVDVHERSDEEPEEGERHDRGTRRRGPGRRRDIGLTVPDQVGAKNRRSTAHSTAIAANHGNAMIAPKRAKLSPLALKAKRLVRFETGRSSEAEFARWVQA